MARFEGRVAMVTGAGQGIGRAIAARLADEGASVAVVDRNREGAEATMRLLRHSGAAVEPVIVDLSTLADAERATSSVLDTFGKIDVLVNNVGGTMTVKPFCEYTEDEIIDEIERSLWTAVWTCRAVLPHMIKAGTGSVVNLGSTSPRGPYRVPYATAKGGVIALTTSLANELADKGIRVNCVAPGATEVTDRVVPRAFSAPEAGEDKRGWRQELMDFFEQQIPMRRWGQSSEQAAAVAFLASDDASFITGQTVVVAGGAFL